MTFGSFAKSLSLRDLFPNEANDFTPWLAKNNIIPTILEEIEKKTFKFWKREVGVGDYRVDMIYQSKDRSESYLVENQFGLSDNKHLGQIVMYRYLTKIKKALWICDEVDLEHQEVMKSLVDVDCIPCTMSFIELSNSDYRIIARVYTKYEGIKIFIFQCNNQLKKVELKQIV